MPWYYILIIVVAAVGVLVLALWKQYRKVGPNEVLIISGGGKRTVTDPDRGRGAGLWPLQIPSI